MSARLTRRRLLAVAAGSVASIAVARPVLAAPVGPTSPQAVVEAAVGFLELASLQLGDRSDVLAAVTIARADIGPGLRELLGDERAARVADGLAASAERSLRWSAGLVARLEPKAGRLVGGRPADVARLFDLAIERHAWHLPAADRGRVLAAHAAWVAGQEGER